MINIKNRMWHGRMRLYHQKHPAETEINHCPRCSKTSAITKTGRRPEPSQVGRILFHTDHLDSLCHPHASCWILSKFAGFHPLLPLTRMTGHSNKTHLSPRWCHVKDGKWLNDKQLPYGKSISVYSLPLSHRVSFFHGKFLVPSNEGS